MESLSLHQIMMMVQITSWAFGPDDFVWTHQQILCAAKQYLLLGVQLLQDDAYVGAVLCAGAGCGRVGTVLIFDKGVRFIQFGEEGQTVQPCHVFILFSLCSDFTQDLWLCIKTKPSKIISKHRFFFFNTSSVKHIFLPVSPSVPGVYDSDMLDLKQCKPCNC